MWFDHIWYWISMDEKGIMALCQVVLLAIKSIGEKVIL